MKYKTKIFFGSETSMQTADDKFNSWICDKNIKIIDFQYSENQYNKHSIAILYIEG